MIIIVPGDFQNLRSRLIERRPIFQRPSAVCHFRDNEIVTGQFQERFREWVGQALQREGEARSHYRGFSPQEVRNVERMWGRRLPAAYRGFLLVMGRRTGLGFEYVKMSFDRPADLIHFQQHARHLIAEGEVAYETPAGMFFCSNYLDSQLSFFDCDREDDDPLLFEFEVENPKPPVSGLRLSEYVKTVLRI
jgi:hypothetical protein